MSSTGEVIGVPRAAFMSPAEVELVVWPIGVPLHPDTVVHQIVHIGNARTSNAHNCVLSSIGSACAGAAPRTLAITGPTRALAAIPCAGTALIVNISISPSVNGGVEIV